MEFLINFTQRQSLDFLTPNQWMLKNKIQGHISCWWVSRGSPGKSGEERKRPGEADSEPDTMAAHGEGKSKNKPETGTQPSKAPHPGPSP